MRVPCNKNADTHVKVFSPFLFVPRKTNTSSRMRTHTHTHVRQVILCSALDEKQNTEWSSFLQQVGREVTASPSAVQVWCRFFFPLVFLYFPPLRTGPETIELDSVCQAFNVLKIIGWFGRYFFVFQFRVLVQRRPFLAFKQKYSDRRWKPELCFSNRAPLRSLRLPSDLKVWQCQLITCIIQTKGGKQQWPCVPTAHYRGVFMTEGQTWRNKNKKKKERKTNFKYWVSI